MAWKIEVSPDAAKELRRLDRAVAARIVRTIETRIAAQSDPRALGAPLKGEHDGYWRWRIGDYRVIGQIEDARVTVLIVREANRREVYR